MVDDARTAAIAVTAVLIFICFSLIQIDNLCDKARRASTNNLFLKSMIESKARKSLPNKPTSHY
jgi:hypothetical protein